ncbi:hypothetical protein VCHA37O177_180081 [Vibrio chagasii]|nr:hypothetical protein VCHA37O177_180081 [Vibrio chagasii]
MAYLMGIYKIQETIPNEISKVKRSDGENGFKSFSDLPKNE